jgi:N utilization substance protein B
MGSRSKSRKRALDILFESEMRGLPLGATLEERRTSQEQSVGEYTVRLVEGVRDHQARIDELIGAYSTGWTLDRMPAVDRNALRIGVFELIFGGEVPEAVAITEAMNLVRDLSTEESPAFVNGVLGAILRDKAVVGHG